MNYRIIVATSGYIESGQVGFTAWTFPGRFENPEDAVKSLSIGLFKLYLSFIPRKDRFDKKVWPECCIFKSCYHPDDKCPTCGALLRGELTDTEDFLSFMESLPKVVADGFSTEDVTDWWPWNCYHEIVAYPEQTIEIIEKFDNIALYYAAQQRFKVKSLSQKEDALLEEFLNEFDDEYFRGYQARSTSGFPGVLFG